MREVLSSTKAITTYGAKINHHRKLVLSNRREARPPWLLSDENVPELYPLASILGTGDFPERARPS